MVFRRAKETTEARIQRLFGFLLEEKGFRLAVNNLGDAVDAKGRFFFYGPVIAYCLYCDTVCINILHLVQRDDYSIYVTKAFQPDQIYMRNGVPVPERLAYDLDSFADEVCTAMRSGDGLYGFPVE